MTPPPPPPTLSISSHVIVLSLSIYEDPDIIYNACLFFIKGEDVVEASLEEVMMSTPFYVSNVVLVSDAA